MIRYHMAAFLVGFLLDQCIGDPHGFPHPIRWIGLWIQKAEQWLYPNDEKRKERKELWAGVGLVILVLGGTILLTGMILYGSYRLHPYVGVAVESVMTYYILAVKCLKEESMRVYDCLKHGTLPEARKAVSMIVGRDTECLTEIGVAKAAIETVAENASDGVIAPLLYTAIGGPVLGFFYKAANTMDSMIGYKNDRYLYFGRAAAKFDDVLNYIPSRVSAWLMIASAFLNRGDISGTRAIRIYRRDRRKHASPNAAQTEAACAGALGIQLAGNAVYFGKEVEKPFLGDAIRDVEYEDIRRANRLMYQMAFLCVLICLLVMWSLSR